MALPHAIATKNPLAVCRYTTGVFALSGWGESTPLLDALFRDATRLFQGEWPGYLAIDMRYHDLEHTLQATVCMADLLRGQVRHGAAPALGRRDAEKVVAAVLLHDAGFIKRADDPAGTGAKYTFVHEQRSCEFARAYLPTLGFTAVEIDDICAAISCTGPRNRISAQNFSSPEARHSACLLVTADYLAQLAAPDYPDELDILFAEFEEAADFAGVPREQRLFQSARELKQKTPDFWERFVQPMLQTEADGVSRFLGLPDGANPYLEAVTANIAEIRRRQTQA